MDNLGIEFISVFGMPPVDFVKFAASLDVRNISTSLEGFEYNPHGYPRYSLRKDRAMRRDLVSALGDNGVSISLGEGYLVTPGVDGGDSWSLDLEVMSELGIRRINSVSFDADFSRNVDQYGLLAETASRFGIESMVEFVPGFGVADLPTAIELARQVGRPDFRLLIDTMHAGRSGATAADLAALPPDLVGYIQLCDAPWAPAITDYLEEAMYERRIPGEGELPLLDFLAALPRNRVIGLEVPLRSAAAAGVGPHGRLAPAVAAARNLFGALDARGPA